MKLESKIKNYRNKIVLYHKHQNEVLRFDTGLTISKKDTFKRVYSENIILIDTIKSKIDSYIKDAIINNAYNRVLYVRNQLNNRQNESNNDNPNAVYCWHWFMVYYNDVILGKVKSKQIESGTAKPYFTIANAWKTNEVLNKIKIHSFSYEHIDYFYNTVNAKNAISVKNKRLIHLGAFSDWLNDEVGLANDIRKHINKFKKENKKTVKVITATPISFTNSDLLKLTEQKKYFVKRIEQINEYQVRYKKQNDVHLKRDILEEFCVEFGYKRLFNGNINNAIRKLNTYIKVIDITLVSCSTGLNWCDLQNTTAASINNNLITGKRIKTGVSYQIPYVDLTKEILQKYNYAVTSGITPNTYNKTLKELIKSIGIDRNVNRVDTCKGENEVVKLSEIACHKLCRKTFITLIIEGNKISLNHAISMFGHSSYDMLQHYANRNVLSGSVNQINEMFAELTQ